MSSVASRKCGVHLLQPPSIITTSSSSSSSSTSNVRISTTTENNIDKLIMMESSRKSSGDLPNSSTSCEMNSSTNYEKNMVEAFLDENTDFLEDYVRRKVLTKTEKSSFHQKQNKISAEKKLNESFLKYLDKKVTFCKLFFQRVAIFNHLASRSVILNWDALTHKYALR